MLKNKNIVIGVTGGIAVYKAVDVVSRLKKLGANIDIIMTNSATEFVTPLTFQSLSQNHVNTDIFNEPKAWDIEHISLANKADLFLIVPATANIIGKVASGIADDMLSTTIMATKSKVVFVPAMNTNMYTNAVFERNMKILRDLDYEFIEPASGRLACGDYGKGKLADPIDIVDYVVDVFKDKDIIDRKIVITAGPTIEPLDPVRYMTNYSSGKMGYALAEAAKNKGAEVVLITGPTHLTPPLGVKVINVDTTKQMYESVENEFDNCDILIKSAAPLDYRPVNTSTEKIKKTEDNMKVEFIKNKDIAAHFGSIKKNQLIIGFAAETEDLIENAKSKLESKNLDFIVANNVKSKDSGFRTDNNKATIIDNLGKLEELPDMSKTKLAEIIIDKASTMLKTRNVN